MIKDFQQPLLISERSYCTDTLWATFHSSQLISSVKSNFLSKKWCGDILSSTAVFYLLLLFLRLMLLGGTGFVLFPTIWLIFKCLQFTVYCLCSLLLQRFRPNRFFLISSSSLFSELPIKYHLAIWQLCETLKHAEFQFCLLTFNFH